MAIGIERIVLTFIVQTILILTFGYIGTNIMKRKKTKLNLYFSMFFFSLTIGNIINIIYVLIYAYGGTSLELVVVIMHLITNFFNFFGLAFLFVVNQIILKSAMVFTQKDILRYFLIYGGILIVGTILIQIFEGVTMSSSGYPKWSIYYFLFILLSVVGIALFPILNTSYKIFNQLEGEEIRRRYLYFLLGIFGLSPLLVVIIFSNLLDIPIFRTITSILSISMILWVILIYYGLRRQTTK
ncbi:MAG: conserved membrane protein of unknown function [Promethearchaeota archaeon]|nr:MAG: conserved membrane protein of unknown function [Candidatus Lokiarchaeota archaeon]